jgi:transglutaminase-like putative cysteine protease
MTWTRPPLRTRYLRGTNWRKRRATAAAVRKALPQVPAALAGLPEGSAETWAYDLLGSDTDQVRQKVELIRTKVVAPALGPGPRGLSFVRGLLAEILGAAPAGVNSNRKPWLAAYLFSWIRTHIRYVNDPSGQEVFTQIPEILAHGYGDCDDLTALVAVLFGAVGIRVKARVIQTPRAPGWSHIYPVAWLDDDWRAFDASWPTARPGWEFRSRMAVMDLEVQP